MSTSTIFFRQHESSTPPSIEEVKPKIINLSSYKLDTHQIDLLKLGTKFCPTPKANIIELKNDLKEFERKLRIKEKFLDTDLIDESLVRNTSTYFPEKGTNKELEDFFKRLWDLHLGIKSNIKDNLSAKQKKALNDLINNKEIIIKEADKGNAIVIMNKDYYIAKIQEMLNDTENYEPMEKKHGQYNHILYKKAM